MKHFTLLVLLCTFAAISVSEGATVDCYTCNQQADENCNKSSEEWGLSSMKQKSPERPVSCFVTMSSADPQSISNRGQRVGDDVKVPEDPSTYTCRFEEGNLELCYCFTSLCNAKVPNCKVRANPKAKCL